MSRSRLAILPFAVALAAVGCAGAAGAPPSWTAAPTARPAAVQVTAAPPTAAPPTASPATGLAVVLSEWKVTVPATIKAGAVDFVITNTGAAPHELLVFKTNVAAAAYPTNSAGGIDEAAGPPMSDGDNVEPGGSQTRTIDLAPGTYLFVCNIPGHYKQGMFALVTVTP